MPRLLISRFKSFEDFVLYARFHDSDEINITNRFGQNIDLDANVEEDIWSYGGTRVWPTSAQTYNITSTSANDTSAGTGARTVRITGLDSDYNSTTEDVTLNGTSNVATTTSFINISDLVVMSVGSGEVNAGTITATGTSSSQVIAAVPIGYNRSQMSHYQVPLGYSAFFMQESISGYRESGKTPGDRNVEILTRTQRDGLPQRVSEVKSVTSSTIEANFSLPPLLREKDKIWFSATASTNDSAAAVQFSLILIKNTYLP